jgi:hypothetical protein
MRVRNMGIIASLCVVAICESGDAMALTEKDILGMWCTGQGGRTEFTRSHMNIVRVGDKKRLRFRITKYDFSDTTVIVYWTDVDGSAHQTTYGKFGPDGRTMIQTKTTPERQYRRC